MTTTKMKFPLALTLGFVASGWTFTSLDANQPMAIPATPMTASQAANQPQKTSVNERMARGSDRIANQNRLKLIMLAIHDYFNAKSRFPQDIKDKNGEPLLSWRVELLPYIEQDADENHALYKQFNFNEPWDSEHNKKLVAKMPDIYRLKFQPKEETKTYSQFFGGPGTAFDPGPKLKMVDVLDEKTLGVVEAGPPVDWTKPADIPYAPKKPFPKLELPYKNVFTVAFMNGATYTLKPDLDPKILQKLIGRDDEQPAPDLKTLKANLRLTKEELEELPILLIEKEKFLEVIAEQVREQRRLIGELITLKDLPDLPPDDDHSWGGGDSRLFILTSERLKSRNKELQKLIDAKKK